MPTQDSNLKTHSCHFHIPHRDGILVSNQGSRGCSNGHNLQTTRSVHIPCGIQELSEGLRYPRDSSLGTVGDKGVKKTQEWPTVCSFSWEGDPAACQPSCVSSTRRAFAVGSVGEQRWEMNLFLPSFHLPLLPFFPPFKWV